MRLHWQPPGNGTSSSPAETLYGSVAAASRSMIGRSHLDQVRVEVGSIGAEAAAWAEAITAAWLERKNATDQSAPTMRERVEEHIGVPLDQADDEIGRLRDQVAAAHAILGSEATLWLTGGTANHPAMWWAEISPAILRYWEKYGNVFRPGAGDPQTGGATSSSSEPQ
jgi:hypothetical protein